MKKPYVILAAIVVVIVSAAFWAFTHSFITITVNNPGAADDFTYTLIGDDGSTKTITSADPTIRTLVGKGSYQVVVSQAETSAMAVKQTSSFLRSTDITLDLAAEASRRFVGDNPAPCMYYIGDRLISGECNNDADELRAHVPATASLPTYAATVKTNTLIGTMSNMARTQSGAHIALVSLIADGGINYFLQEVNPDLSGGKIKGLDLDESASQYSVAPHGTGVVVYDNEFRQFVYAPNLDNEPTQVIFDLPNDEDLQPIGVTVQQASINLLYSSQTDSVHEDEDTTGRKPGTRSGTTEVVIYRQGKQQHVSLDQFFSAAYTCGTNKLCMLDGIGMTVYDLSTEKPEVVYRLNDVDKLAETATGLVAISNTAVTSLDIDNATGFREYSLGDYHYCGLQIADNGYVLCLISSYGGKRALYLTPTSPTTDSIDKQVLMLQKSIGVKAVSPYGKYIYIVPDYGEPTYNPASKIYEYAPQKVKLVDKQVAEAVTKSGIDQSVYQIVNASKP